jgi:hypothetical protein
MNMTSVLLYLNICFLSQVKFTLSRGKGISPINFSVRVGEDGSVDTYKGESIPECDISCYVEMSSKDFTRIYNGYVIDQGALVYIAH